MASENSRNGETKDAFQNRESTLAGLTTVPTSVTLSTEQFERLYLTPMTVRQSSLSKQMGNPTPLWVFKPYLLFLLPWRFHLMAWFNLQGTRRLCHYYDPAFVLLDGLERSQWKWSCPHVRHNRTTHEGSLSDWREKWTDCLPRWSFVTHHEYSWVHSRKYVPLCRIWYYW
jgi:hypothetical protein